MSDNKTDLGKIAAPNPFDPAALRVTGDLNTVGAHKLLLRVPARKPTKQEFFKVNASPDMKLASAILETKEDHEIYLVHPSSISLLPNDVRYVELCLCQNRQGGLFLWPVPLPGHDGRTNSWHESAREAARLAEKYWIRIVANMSEGGYDVYKATGNLPDPEWPEKSLQDLLEVAFKDGKLIDSEDHPVVKLLNGR